jgi:hypothetical protein
MVELKRIEERTVLDRLHCLVALDIQTVGNRDNELPNFNLQRISPTRYSRIALTHGDFERLNQSALVIPHEILALVFASIYANRFDA